MVILGGAEREPCHARGLPRGPAAGALTGASNHGSTKALYASDPDGIEFEVCWLVPDDRVEEELVPGMPPTRPLDFAAEIERYGADTLGGPREDPAVWQRIFAGR